MISNQILQSTIDGLKEYYARIDLCVCDTEGNSAGIYVCVMPEITTETIVNLYDVTGRQPGGCWDIQFFKVFDEHQLEYVLLAKGGSDDVYMVGKIGSIPDPEPA